ncbi:hypothetical protein DRO19_00605 [Candidatus Bathyarchaeota archaeon]|nr:MAG: hypothetical protein DRO19_00605 [Candidatus Bathyarchaeota archaeon]
MKLNMFMVAGIVLILFGILYPMVTLIVDNTPPVVGITLPADGKVYTKIDHLVVYCYDAESGIANVYVWIGDTRYILQYTGKEPQSPYQIWELDISGNPITASGTYDFNIHVTNKAGLTRVVSGTFTIYIELQGKWYINGLVITSSADTIYATSPTVTFKFVKTQGIEDSKISCWVEEAGTKLVTLTYQGNGVWEGSYTFTLGVHNIDLVATDSTTTITMSIVRLDFGGGEETPFQLPSWLNWQLAILLVGGLLLAYGFIRRS